MKKISILIASVLFFTHNIYAQVNTQDRNALIEIYNALGGANWTNPWDLSQPVNTWAGVTLAGDRVTRLNLDNRNLSGTLSSIKDVQLSALTHFYINNAYNITGNLPNFSGMPNLVDLRITRTGLNGVVEEPTNMPKLTTLYIVYNYSLGGAVPAFTSVPELQVFQGSYNKFTSISSSYSLPKIQRFDVINQNYAGGGISGPIPDFTGSSNLQYLVLAQNKFTGTIDNLENNTKLTNVLVFENQLSGQLPAFVNSPNLRVIYARNNQFSGQAPDYNHLNLTQLIINNNQLSGTPPNITGTNLNTLQFYTVENNLYDFSSFENIANTNLANTYLKNPAKTGGTYNPQIKYNLTVSGNTLNAEEAGGTVDSIIYYWYKVGASGDTTLITTIHGNSTIDISSPEYGLQVGDVVRSAAHHDSWTEYSLASKRLILYSNDYTISTILPVGFGDLTAFIQNGKLLLNWNTISETNNDKFIIEVSKTGIDGWKKVAEVKSKAVNGNSVENIDYATELNVANALGLLAATMLFGLFIPGISRRKRIVLSILALSMTFGYFSCKKSDLVQNVNTGEKIFVRLSQVDKDGTTKVLKIQEAVRK